MPTRYRVNDANVAWRIADDEAVVLHADSSAYFGLNATGTLVWMQLVDRPLDLEEVTAWARMVFPDASAKIQGELASFIDELVQLELIESDQGTDRSAGDLATKVTVGGALPPWEAPVVERFGELEKLILSGE